MERHCSLLPQTTSLQEKQTDSRARRERLSTADSSFSFDKSRQSCSDFLQSQQCASLARLHPRQSESETIFCKLSRRALRMRIVLGKSYESIRTVLTPRPSNLATAASYLFATKGGMLNSTDPMVFASGITSRSVCLPPQNRRSSSSKVVDLARGAIPDPSRPRHPNNIRRSVTNASLLERRSKTARCLSRRRLRYFSCTKVKSIV